MIGGFLLTKLAGAASFIPGVGILPGIFSSLLSALAAILRLLFDGVTAIVANPAALVTAAAVAGASLGFGFKKGMDWQDHKVALAYEQVRHANRQIKSIGEKSQHAAAEKKLAADDAAKTAPQPETSTEIAALCQKSASCREKAK